MSPEEPKRRDARRNRDLILDAAAEALASDPDASLQEIAVKSGVSRATVYRHFANIDAVRAALLAEVEELGRTVLQDGLKEAMSGQVGAMRISDQMLRILSAALPVKTRYSETVAKARHPEEGLIRTFAPVLRATIVEGQSRGEFRRDVEVDATVDALITLMIHAGRRVHRDGLEVGVAVDPVRTFLRGLSTRP